MIGGTYSPQGNNQQTFGSQGELNQRGRSGRREVTSPSPGKNINGDLRPFSNLTGSIGRNSDAIDQGEMSPAEAMAHGLLDPNYNFSPKFVITAETMRGKKTQLKNEKDSGLTRYTGDDRGLSSLG